MNFNEKKIRFKINIQLPNHTFLTNMGIYIMTKMDIFQNNGLGAYSDIWGKHHG